MLVLSIFPGIDLLGRAFEEVGYCVVRGPDLLWGGDIHTFHPPAGKFDGVIGGPPCQMFSSARGGSAPRHGNLIPEFERVVKEARPRWFLMEEVPQAPIPMVHGYSVHMQYIGDVWVGGLTRRVRAFSFGNTEERDLIVEQLALHCPNPLPTATTSIWKDGRQYGAKTRKDYERVREWQGLPSDYELPGFTVSESVRAVVNGVPMAMGRAVAKAVKRAMELQT